MREAIQEITQLQEKAKEHRDEIKRLQQENRRLLVLMVKVWDICDWVPPLLRERIFRNWKASDERALADVVTRGRVLVEEAGRGGDERTE